MPEDETREEGRQPSHSTVRLAPDAAIAARRKYLFEGVEPGREVPAPILRSWERSFALGLNMASRPGLDLLSQQMLREAQQRNEILVRAARGEMEALCRDASIAVVVLTDPHGLVLCRLGQGEFAEKAASVALQPGAVWEEQAAGTNAIGAALAEGQSISVIGGEHFFEAHSILSCSASPIYDPYGAIAGVLDLTNASNEPQALTMALVNRAAEQIERALFDAQFRNCEQMHFHPDPYLIGSPHEGSLAFEGDRLVGANRNGISLLGLHWPARSALSFDELFTFEQGGISHNPSSDDCIVQTKKGEVFYARLQPRPRVRRSWSPAQPAAVEPPKDLTLTQIIDRISAGPYARLITVRRVKAGQLIYGADEEKAVQEGLVVVRSGRLRCFASFDGKELTLFTLDAGDALPINEASMFEVKRDGEIVIFSGKSFQELAQCDPDLARSAMPAISRMLRQSARMTEDIVFRCVKHRLVRALCDAAARDGRRCKDGIVLDAPPSAEEFAMHIGATRQSVSTIIAELIRDRAIRRLDASAIAIADLDRLKAMLE